MRGQAWLAGAFAVATAAIVHASAHASDAGFDCRSANTFIEKAICARPDIAALDEQMATAFQAKMQRRSQAERALLLDNQCLWLKSRDGVCEKRRDIGECLEAQYDARLAELQSDADVSPFKAVNGSDFIGQALVSSSPAPTNLTDLEDTMKEARRDDRIVSCSRVLDVPVTRFETGFGGTCKLREKSGRYVQALICADTAVGNFRLVVTGEAVASKLDLAHFIVDNCAGG
jgi:uncharacterized protein